MNWFTRIFKPKPKTERRRMPGEQVAVVLRNALASRLAANYRHIGTKRVMAVTARSLVQWASDDSYMPWIRDAWECEDQAMALVVKLQTLAANEGCSHACGMLVGVRAKDLQDEDYERHAWVWVLLDNGDAAPRFAVFDPTERDWADIDDIADIYFTMA